MSLLMTAVDGGVGMEVTGVGLGDGDGVGVGDAVGVGVALGLGDGLGVGVGLGLGAAVLLTVTAMLPDFCEAPLESHAITTTLWLPVVMAIEVSMLAAET